MTTLVTITSPTNPLSVEGWTNQYQTMSGMLADLRVHLRSPATAGAGERNRWTDAELYACLRRAMSELAPLVLVGDALTFTLLGNERDYQLPAYVKRITRVRRQGWQRLVTLDGIDDRGAWVDVQEWDYKLHPHGNVFRLKYLMSDSTSLEIQFQRPLQVPPAPPLTITEPVASTTESVLTTALPSQWPVPGLVKIEQELIYYAEISGTQLTGCVRGMQGTVAATHPDNASIDPVIPIEMGDGLAAVMTLAEVYAHEMRMNDQPQSDLSRTITLIQQKSAEHLRLRKLLLQDQPPLTLSNTHQFRPRRRVTVS